MLVEMTTNHRSTGRRVQDRVIRKHVGPVLGFPPATIFFYLKESQFFKRAEKQDTSQLVPLYWFP